MWHSAYYFRLQLFFVVFPMQPMNKNSYSTKTFEGRLLWLIHTITYTMIFKLQQGECTCTGFIYKEFWLDVKRFWFFPITTHSTCKSCFTYCRDVYDFLFVSPLFKFKIAYTKDAYAKYPLFHSGEFCYAIFWCTTW